MMKEFFRRQKKTLEYRRMTQVLATELGVVINHKKVLRIMTKYGLRPTYIKKLRPNYNKHRTQGFIQTDHLQRHFQHRGWVTDITYLMMTTNVEAPIYRRLWIWRPDSGWRTTSVPETILNLWCIPYTKP
jgi:putative transposase